MKGNILLLSLAISSLLSGCGGGSRSDSPTPTTPVAPQPPITTPTTPTVPTYSLAVTSTKADTYRNPGYTGSGVTVAVLDTGISSVSELNDNILDKTNQDYTYAPDGTIIKSSKTELFVTGNRHGDHMSSAIAGSKGIAPDVKIVSGNVSIDSSGNASALNIVQGIGYYQNTASIFNSSFAYFGIQYFTNPGTDKYYNSWNAPLNSIVSKDLLWVHSAGNDGGNISNRLTTPTSTQIDIIKSPTISKQFLIVGAHDYNGTLSWYSAKPGNDADVQSRWITAFGSSDAVLDDGILRSSGTSNAAANVSGSAALMKQRWSHLGGKEISKIILDTADRYFPGYDPSLYGKGKLDLQRAFSPVGVPTASLTSTQPFYLNSISLPSGTKVSSFSTSVFDSYGRDFQIEGSKSFSQTPEYLSEDINQFQNREFVNRISKNQFAFSGGSSYIDKKFTKPVDFLGENNKPYMGFVSMDGYSSGYILKSYHRENPLDRTQTTSFSGTRFDKDFYIISKLTSNPEKFRSNGDFKTTPMEYSASIGKTFQNTFIELESSLLSFGGNSTIKQSYLSSNTIKVGGFLDWNEIRFSGQISHTIGSGELNIYHATSRNESGEIFSTDKVSITQQYSIVSLGISSKNFLLKTNLSDSENLNAILIGYKLEM